MEWTLEGRKVNAYALRSRAVVALLVAAGAAGGANDNHATAVAAVLVGGHFDKLWWIFFFFCCGRRTNFPLCLRERPKWLRWTFVVCSIVQKMALLYRVERPNQIEKKEKK